MPLMMCPNCEAGMQEVNRNGVMLDMCPKCRGVWLDRGELEKLLGSVRETEREWEEERKHYHREEHHHGKPYKKKRFDIFDIFD